MTENTLKIQTMSREAAIQKKKDKEKKQQERLVKGLVNNKNARHIYKLIKQGFQFGAVPLIGRSFTEIRHDMEGFGVKDSTIRYTIWNLKKAGFIEKSGIERSTFPGEKKQNVWRATETKNLLLP